MAVANFSAALPAPAYPQAKPGTGSGTHPTNARAARRTSHTCSRGKRLLAAYIDRLPEGTAIGYKALATQIADYGQQACGKALNFLSEAGHLRRIKHHIQLDDNTFRWVTRTFFSRTAEGGRLVEAPRGRTAWHRPHRAGTAREAAGDRSGAGAAADLADAETAEQRRAGGSGGVRPLPLACRPRSCVLLRTRSPEAPPCSASPLDAYASSAARPYGTPDDALRRRVRGAGTPRRAVAGARGDTGTPHALAHRRAAAPAAQPRRDRPDPTGEEDAPGAHSRNVPT